MENPENLLCTQEHEWIRVDGQDAVIGITQFAQEQLGDIVFVELPEVGTAVTVYVIYESCVLCCLPQSHLYNLIS